MVLVDDAGLLAHKDKFCCVVLWASFPTERSSFRLLGCAVNWSRSDTRLQKKLAWKLFELSQSVGCNTDCLGFVGDLGLTATTRKYVIKTAKKRGLGKVAQKTMKCWDKGHKEQRVLGFIGNKLLCEWCLKQRKTKQCGMCHKVRYCSKKCQKKGWKQHKKECRERKKQQT